MKFILEIRPLTEKDLSSLAPFLPEDGDYEMYVQALSEDIAQVNGILQVTQANSCLYIETEESLSQEELKKRIKTLFTETIMQNLRFVSLAELQLDK